jgi:hypothetical protein
VDVCDGDEVSEGDGVIDGENVRVKLMLEWKLKKV